MLIRSILIMLVDIYAIRRGVYTLDPLGHVRN